MEQTAEEIAKRFFGIRATARQLPSERDQNFLLIDESDQKFVLKIANAQEARAMLEAQNSVLKHLAERVSFCQRVIPASSGEEIVEFQGHFVRLVNYLPRVPLAEIKPHSPALLRDLGRRLGQLSCALADFDHLAAHRDFHWDLANGNRVISEHGNLIRDASLRELVFKCRIDLEIDLRRSVIHGDTNDHNVLVDNERISGLIDFGDMVYSYTVADLAIAIAYVVLEKEDPFGAAAQVVAGYREEFQLLENEVEVLWQLVLLRLAMSVCIAAYQQQQQPENEYLGISQRSILKALPRLATDLHG